MKLLTPSKNRRGDYLILILTTLISLFGIVMIYSASYYTAQTMYGDKFFYVKKQLVGFLIGLVGMFLAAKFDFNFLNKIKIPILIVGIILLVLVLTPLGVENYGAKRWIGVGSITIQPSEIAKFCYVIFVAGYFADNPSRARSFLGIIPPLLIGCVICFLIMLEPNMSITLCVGGVMISMLFMSGINIKHLILILIPIVILVPVLIISEPYRLKRLMAFINPWLSPKGEGYQLIQSLYALGSGGFFGVGIFNSRQKYRFLPFAESDFILSIIGEELGFFGVLLLFLTLIFLLIRGFKVVAKAKSVFAFLLAGGINMVFIIQVAVNALVVTGSIPPTGLPLPLISCGSTSLIVFMTAFGLLYNLSKDSAKI